MAKSTTELGGRQKEVLKRASGRVKIPIVLIGKWVLRKGLWRGKKDLYYEKLGLNGHEGKKRLKIGTFWMLFWA